MAGISQAGSFEVRPPRVVVAGLGSEHRMNLPGTLGSSNWSWRFDWPMLGTEPARRLGEVSAVSGRGPIALLGR